MNYENWPTEINFDLIKLIKNAHQSILKSYGRTAAMPTAFELKALEAIFSSQIYYKLNRFELNRRTKSKNNKTSLRILTKKNYSYKLITLLCFQIPNDRA